MCGIAGVVRWGRHDGIESEIGAMTRALAHRGPDGEGIHVCDGVALGHRRLAIIDLESGAQPMFDDRRQLCITHNGEIYNYRELRRLLEGRGHRFRTNSDTEVILHAYREWGAACVDRLRGMFAFAIADFAARSVFLARDPLGIKPLHYRLGTDYFAFASELRTLRKVADAPPRGRLDAVDLFLRYRALPAPDTIFAGIHKLEPGTWLSVGFDGVRRGPVQYWDVDFGTAAQRTPAEWDELVGAAIEQSVGAHMVADVPFGLLLSGGIDSTLVALAMTRQHAGTLHAFTIGFAETDWDELKFAARAAQRCGITLHTERLDERVLHGLPDLLPYYGEPFGDSSALPTWRLARLARGAVPMVLSGDGGDEAFAGYDRYMSWLRNRNAWSLLRRGMPRVAAAVLRRRLRYGPGNGGGWEPLLLRMSDRRRRALWKRDRHNVVAAPCIAVERAHARAAAWDPLSYAQYLDYRTYLGGILTKVDSAAMSHGLEVRTPLIDRHIVALATALPPAERASRNGAPGGSGKIVLKRLAARDFPDDFVHRRKQGFSMPLARWFAPGRVGAVMFDDVVLDTGSRLHEWFTPAGLRRERRLHTATRDNSDNLWALLVLGLWLEQNPDIGFGG
jgi:asparagine synthase (glutamine-hydrolysing)